MGKWFNHSKLMQQPSAWAFWAIAYSQQNSSTNWPAHLSHKQTLALGLGLTCLQLHGRACLHVGATCRQACMPDVQGSTFRDLGFRVWASFDTWFACNIPAAVHALAVASRQQTTPGMAQPWVLGFGMLQQLHVWLACLHHEATCRHVGMQVAAQGLGFRV